MDKRELEELLGVRTNIIDTMVFTAAGAVTGFLALWLASYFGIIS